MGHILKPSPRKTHNGTSLPDPSQTATAPLMRLPSRRGAAPLAPAFVNLCGDYRFLRGGYWALVDSELNGVESRPSPMQAVTGQNAAASLLVAAQHGIPCATWKVAKRPEDVAPPCILVPNAGHTDTYYHVQSPRAAASQWRSATQNGTRAALAIHKSGPLKCLKVITGVTTNHAYDLAWRIWAVFGLPLCTVWYLDAPEGPLFVSLDPLPLHELTERELRMYEGVSARPMSQ